MKIIGLIGGTSWKSTQEYYRIINEGVNKKLGGLHSAKIVMYSVDLEEVIKYERQGKWDKIAEIIIYVAKILEKAGADFILICSNTLHKLVDDVQNNIKIPLIDVRDIIANKIKSRGFKKVGLLGLKPTVEEDFYKGRLSKKHGIEVVIPAKEERQIVHNIILNELCLGKIKKSSKEKLKKIINNLVDNGAEAIILGCTELSLLIKQKDVKVSLFDTTRIHAETAVEYALK